MHQYAYTYIYTCIYIHTPNYTCTQTSIYIYTCSYTHIHTHIYRHMYSVHICTHVSTPGTTVLQRLREKPNLAPRKLCTSHLEMPFDEIRSTSNDGSAQNNHNQQQLIKPSRQRTARTTTSNLHWCGANPLGSWPAQAASPKVDAPKTVSCFRHFPAVLVCIRVNHVS